MRIKKVDVGDLRIELAFRDALIIRHTLIPSDRVCVSRKEALSLAKAIMEIYNGSKEER